MVDRALKEQRSLEVHVYGDTIRGQSHHAASGCTHVG
jgi:hypothetical protein